MRNLPLNPDSPLNIGQAAQAAGVSTKMIRYYEGIGLIRQAGRTSAGYRQYSTLDVQTLRFIKRSRELGFSIERIGALLALWRDRTRASADVKRLAIAHIGELDDTIGKLQSIRDQLARLADHCHGDERPDCPIIDDMAGRKRSVEPRRSGKLPARIERSRSVRSR